MDATITTRDADGLPLFGVVEAGAYSVRVTAKAGVCPTCREGAPPPRSWLDYDGLGRPALDPCPECDGLRRAIVGWIPDYGLDPEGERVALPECFALSAEAEAALDAACRKP